jgi:protein-glutamine gamma-glutamyltransferase
MKHSLSENSIPLNSLYYLGGGLVLSTLPHSQRIPYWIMALFLMLCSWKLYSPSQTNLEKKNFSLIRIFLFILMMAGFAGVYFHFGTIIGRNAGVSLLVLLAGFKVIEINHQRDFYVSCFLGYFLVVTNFLYVQTIGTAIYMACTVLVMTLSLVSFNDSQRNLSARASGKIAAALLLQSIPVMLVLFLLFPRISGPLWGMPDDAHSGLTGIDDEMSPGSISQLIQSNKVAFRVDFKNTQPEASQLYWRGPVLLHSDGSTWRRGKSEYYGAVPLQILSDPVAYTVTLEAHNQKWLYALEMPDQNPKLESGQNWMTSDFQLLTRNPVRGRIRYDITSYPKYRITEYHEGELQTALQLPQRQHGKTRALMHQWQNEGLTESQIIDRALKLFNEDDFYYTLNPPLLENDRVDEFLFETKQGFCEHYASAFVVMMRAAGIPARVVLGYQGGEYNPVGDYFVVHQRNAHAWTEVWRQKQGWSRIDPTAAVSPLRIIEGIESALPNDVLDVPLVFSQNSLTRELWQHLSYRWDAVNNQWNQWVISYGPKRQKEFLGQFGLQDINWSSMIFLIIAFVILILIYITFILLKFTPEKRDPVKSIYDKFCRKLSRCGIHRDISEGPVDFARRASLKRNDLAPQIKNITEMYIAIRYGSNSTQIPKMQKQVHAFKPSTS